MYAVPPLSAEKLAQVRTALQDVRAALAAETGAQPTVKQAEPTTDAPAAITLPGKGLIPRLNTLLASEYTAIHQYDAHYAFAVNLGLNKLAAELDERRTDERKHADGLLFRIVYLNGTPVVDTVPAALVCTTVAELFQQDSAKELEAIRDYNEAIAEAVAAKDGATRRLLEANLKDEDDHADENKTAQDQIALMGLGQYLSTKV